VTPTAVAQGGVTPAALLTMDDIGATEADTAVNAGGSGVVLRRLTHADPLAVIQRTLRALGSAFSEERDRANAAAEDAAAAAGEELVIVLEPPTCDAAAAEVWPPASTGGNGKGGKGSGVLYGERAAASGGGSGGKGGVSPAMHAYSKLRFFDTCAS
jgi:hypothetical protein